MAGQEGNQQEGENQELSKISSSSSDGGLLFCLLWIFKVVSVIMEKVTLYAGRKN